MSAHKRSDKRSVFSYLPQVIINEILSYDDVIRYRRGHYVNRISNNDERKELIKKIPPIIPLWVLMPGELKEETFPYYYTSELTEKIKIRFVPNYANNTILFLFIKDNEQKNRYYIR